MLPTNGHAVASGPQRAYEIKHDGFRFIVRRELDRVRVFSRRGNDWTDRVPRIAEALATLPVTSITIDGEGVVCRPDGVADFDRLRAAVGRKDSRGAFLYAFDYWNLTATTRAGSLGQPAVMRWRGSYARANTIPSCTKVSAFPSISTALMAISFSDTPASSGRRELSPSAGTDPISQIAHRTKSRSRNRTRQRR